MQKLRNWIYHKLRKSERLFKTDMVYVAKGGFWLIGGQILTSLASFTLALLFARLVTQEVYGNYRYILSLAGLISLFSLNGLANGILQSVARGYYGTFLTAVRTAFRWNTILFGLSFAAGVYYLMNDNATLGHAFLLISVTLPAIKVLELYESYLNGTRQFREHALYRGMSDIATMATTASALFLTQDPFKLVAVNVLTQLVSNAYFFRKIYTRVRAFQILAVEPNILSFSKHLSFQGILTSASTHLDKIIVFHYLGAAEVAVYTFALALPQQVKGLAGNLSLLILPKISRRSAKEAVTTIPHRFFLSLLILIPVILLYIIFAPELFRIFFPAYIEAVPYTRWYALILLIMGNLSGMILTTQKAVKEQYVLNVFSSTAQIGLMLLLVHRFHIYGIIWAILISKFANAILSYLLARRLASKSSQ